MQYLVIVLIDHKTAVMNFSIPLSLFFQILLWCHLQHENLLPPSYCNATESHVVSSFSVSVDLV